MGNRKRCAVISVGLGLAFIAAPALLLHLETQKERLARMLLNEIREVHTAEVTSLLAHGADPNVRIGDRVSPAPVDAIMRALHLYHDREPGAADGMTALELALQPDNDSPAKAAVDANLLPARETMALALIGQGADPNRYRPLDQPPLCVAAGLGMSAVVELMLKHGARVNCTDFLGNSALMESRSGDTARVLIRNGANPNWRSREGLTPLLQECLGYYGMPSLDKVRELVSAGSDVNAVCAETESKLSGLTPLMLTVRNPASSVSVDLVSILLNHGASPSMTDSDGHNAIYYVVHPDSDDIPAATKLRLISLLSRPTN